MFTGILGSMSLPLQSCRPTQIHVSVTPSSCPLAYTDSMRTARSIHLLVAAAILFSQIVAGVHMAGHVHLPAGASLQVAHADSLHAGPNGNFAAEFASELSGEFSAELTAEPTGRQTGRLTSAEHDALHSAPLHGDSQGPVNADRSCVIYHVYAGSQCIGASSSAVAVASVQTSAGPPTTVSAQRAPLPEHYFIRGPPLFS